MAKVKCPECNKKVSEKAEACPKCGYPIKSNIKEIRSKERKEFFMGFVVLITIVVGVLIFNSPEENKSVNQNSSEIKQSELVKKTQEGLNELGFDAGTADGIYGPKTKSAILSYQEKCNLIADGKVTESLLKHINEAINPESKITNNGDKKIAIIGIPNIGEVCVIKNSGLKSLVATNKAAWDKFMDCILEDDKYGVMQMVASEKLIGVEDGTKVQLLDIPGWFSASTAKIRILSGEYSGLVGYTLTSNLQ